MEQVSNVGGEYSVLHRWWLAKHTLVQTAKRIIILNLRQEDFRALFDRGDFEIISATGVVIHPHIWPTGIGPGSEIELVIGDGRAVQGKSK